MINHAQDYFGQIDYAVSKMLSMITKHAWYKSDGVPQLLNDFLVSAVGSVPEMSFFLAISFFLYIV